MTHVKGAGDIWRRNRYHEDPFFLRLAICVKFWLEESILFPPFVSTLFDLLRFVSVDRGRLFNLLVLGFRGGRVDSGLLLLFGLFL